MRYLGTALGILLATNLAIRPAAAQQQARRFIENELPSAAFSEGWSNPFPEAIIAASPAREMANARIALEFYDRMINKKSFSAAAELIGPRYDQHELAFGNGPDGLRSLMADLAQRQPQAAVQVKRVITDGEYVVLHSHFRETPTALGSVAGDIFRLENGKIVERWSILHPITQRPSPANPNGTFGGRDDGSRRD